MKRYIALLSIPLIMIAGELDYKGNISFETQKLSTDNDEKRDHAEALRIESEFKKEIGIGQMAIKIKGIYDANDHNRRYIDFNDLYYQLNFENSDLLIGRNTRFWGALEFFNLTDVFNTKDFLDDPFDYDSKLGAWNIAYTYYLESGEFSIIAKLHEEKQRMQDSRSLYNFLPFAYDDHLQTAENVNLPSLYLKYSASLERVQMDYSLIYEHGYDGQRFMDFHQGSLRQHAYIVDKFLAYSTLVMGDMIYKSELAYTFSDDTKVSDYGQIGLGGEYTFYGVWDKRDLGLLAEYYRYMAEDDTKLSAKDFANFFDDDMSVGFRLSMNDFASSEVLGGLDIDLGNQEKIFFVKYDTRVFEKYKLALSYQHLAPKSDSMFEKLDRAKLEFGYYF